MNITREQLSDGINNIVDDDNYISLNDLINFFYEQLTCEKKILNDEISELNNKISDLNEEVNDLNSSLLSTSSENFKELKRYAEKSYDIKSQNKTLKNKINQLNNELSDLKSSLVSIKSESKIEKLIESESKIKEQGQEQEQGINNNIIGGNINNLPKNYIYNINGLKKLNISGDGINFTTCTDQDIINNAHNRKIQYTKKKRKEKNYKLQNDNIANNNIDNILKNIKPLKGQRRTEEFFKNIINNVS